MISVIVLAIMLLKIVVIDGEKYTKAVVNQRISLKYSKEQRGKIYDKNMIPLVDSRTYIEKDDFFSFGYTKRYDERNLARHTIGYINGENEGVTGLEKKYNSVLKNNENYKVNIVKDVLNNPINGFGTYIVGDNPKNNLKLTLDYHIQKIVETEIDSLPFNSSVVVLDTETFDVLSIASRPNFNQEDVSEYVIKNGTELIDRSVSEYNAGSIFKIITSAAAIENNVINSDDTFFCSGSTFSNGICFKCHKNDGHSIIDFKDAFVLSCNCAFYEIGIRTGGDKICDVAKKFGIEKKVLNFDWEKEGNSGKLNAYSNADISNISIGQGNVLITPVQAAKIAAIIANDGIEKRINIADSIVNEKGEILQNLKIKEENEVIKRSTAKKISNMMRQSVLHGTGTNAKSNIVKISGKTGTAETGWVDNGNLLVHGWFVGFFPSDNPKYAMSVLLENGQNGNEAAYVFKNIAEKIIKSQTKSRN